MWLNGRVFPQNTGLGGRAGFDRSQLGMTNDDFFLLIVYKKLTSTIKIWLEGIKLPGQYLPVFSNFYDSDMKCSLHILEGIQNYRIQLVMFEDFI